MNILRNALEAIGATLAVSQTLAETIAALERELRQSLFARRVEIRYGERAPRPLEPGEVCVPLAVDGETIGSLSLYFDADPCPGDRELTLLLAAPLAAALAWRAHAVERVRLHALVRTDCLTSLANRMAFDERLAQAWGVCAMRRASLNVALLDIDYFKAYNDIYGHLAGDECLRIVSGLLAEQARSGFEFVARYGGEEFALISETLEAAAAVAAIGDLLQRLEERRIVHEGSTLGRVSISAGVASWIPSDDCSTADVVRDADRSLYRAKTLGRNRICAGRQASAGARA
jgi:diguanylate cyclase (GGDEF)-like protein